MEEALISILRGAVWLGVCLFPIIGFAAPIVFVEANKGPPLAAFVLAIVGTLAGVVLAGVVFGPIALLMKIEQNTRQS